MTWTIRKILLLIILMFSTGMIGTLIWVTTTYQRFSSDTLVHEVEAATEQIIIEHIDKHVNQDIKPFAEIWSRLMTLNRGITENDPRKLSLSADRMFSTIEVTNGVINLRNVVIYNRNLAEVMMAPKGSGESLSEVPGRLEELKARPDNEKRIGFTTLWQTARGRPVHSMILPIGGFRLLGFIEFVTDPVPALADMGNAIGGAFELADRSGSLLIKSQPDEGLAVHGHGGLAAHGHDGQIDTDQDLEAHLERLEMVIHGTGERVWATATVTRDMAGFEKAAKTLRNRAIIAIVVISGGVFLVAVVLLQFAVFSRIKSFVRVLEFLADGKTDVKIPATGRDEFGSMKTALESLRSAVQLNQELQVRSDAELVERKLMELRLRDSRDHAEAANRAKSEFMASMSHELRTPLTSSLGSLGLLSSVMADEFSEQGRELLEVALRNNNALLRLVNELLDFEKILSGTLEFKTGRFDIGALTSNTVKDNQGYAQVQSVNFIFDHPPAPIYAKVDEYRFQQVLNNLLSNAAKFSDPGSDVEISVTANANAGTVTVNVSDNGSGIPDTFKDRIFEKFTQADSSSTRAHGGTGLGLSISKALIEGMGGNLDFRSEVGTGSTFFVTIAAAT